MTQFLDKRRRGKGVRQEAGCSVVPQATVYREVSEGLFATGQPGRQGPGLSRQIVRKARTGESAVGFRAQWSGLKATGYWLVT